MMFTRLPPDPSHTSTNLSGNFKHLPGLATWGSWWLPPTHPVDYHSFIWHLVTCILCHVRTCLQTLLATTPCPARWRGNPGCLHHSCSNPTRRPLEGGTFLHIFTPVILTRVIKKNGILKKSGQCFPYNFLHILWWCLLQTINSLAPYSQWITEIIFRISCPFLSGRAALYHFLRW